jgi:hypothetical protein
VQGAIKDITAEVEGDIRDKVDPKDPEEKKSLVRARDRLSAWFPIA